MVNDAAAPVSDTCAWCVTESTMTATPAPTAAAAEEHHEVPVAPEEGDPGRHAATRPACLAK